jgi:hypothetical protein
MNQQSNNLNSGVLFKNDKRTSEKSPNSKGHCELACPHCGAVSKFWLSAWTKMMKNGVDRFISLAFTADDASVNKPVSAPAKKASDDIDFDDDIPF